VLKERKPADHEQKEQSSAATNNDGQQHGKSGASGINLMSTRHTDAIGHQAPDQCN